LPFPKLLGKLYLKPGFAQLVMKEIGEIFFIVDYKYTNAGGHSKSRDLTVPGRSWQD